MTKIQITPIYRDVKPQGYYVYIHNRASNGKPFYVGKGKSRRAWGATEASDRSTRWMRTARKHGVRIEIAQDQLSEDAAFLLEMWLIAKLRHDGNDLCNMTDGGDGASGFKKEELDRLLLARDVFDSLGNHYPCLQDAARSMRDFGYPLASSSNICACASGVKASVYGRNWSYTEVPPHPYKTGREANEFARKRPVVRGDGLVYSGCREAARKMSKQLGKNCLSSAITHTARGRQSSAYGYEWYYLSDAEYRIISRQDQPSLFAEYHSSLHPATGKSGAVAINRTEGVEAVP